VGERNKIAVLLDEASQDIVHLRVGQERAGWTLRAVHGREVDFVKRSRIATLFLKRDADEQPLAQPPVDVAASSNPNMAPYRAALHQRRDR
jgi:hypothetical protein